MTHSTETYVCNGCCANKTRVDTKKNNSSSSILARASAARCPGGAKAAATKSNRFPGGKKKTRAFIEPAGVLDSARGPRPAGIGVGFVGVVLRSVCTAAGAGRSNALISPYFLYFFVKSYRSSVWCGESSTTTALGTNRRAPFKFWHKIFLRIEERSS